jgi:hypothetical protein
MVWGGISIDGRTELVVVVPQRLNAQIYVETILQELQSSHCKFSSELSTRPRNSGEGVAGHESRSQSD